MHLSVFENDALPGACAFFFQVMNRAGARYSSEKSLNGRRCPAEGGFPFRVARTDLFQRRLCPIEDIDIQRNPLGFASTSKLGVVASASLPESSDFALAAIEDSKEPHRTRMPAWRNGRRNGLKIRILGLLARLIASC